MMPKVLVACVVIFVSVQAHPPSSGYGYNTSNAGYVAQSQPVATVYILPYYKPSYGAAAAPAYDSAAPGYDSASAYDGIDPEVLRLAKLALSLPSAGGPNPAVVNVPQHYSTSYSAPADSYAEAAGSGYGSA